MNLIILSIPIFFVLILAEVVWDYFAQKKVYRLNDAIANISCGIFEQVTGLFGTIFLIGLYVLIYETSRLVEVPTTWPWLIVMFVGIDFCYYWAHRHSHTVNLFWVGHVVHHQSEEYNLSVALRQGALQKVFVGWYYLPLAILGFDPVWFLTLNALQTLYQFWIHTELVDKMGAFGYVFNTPSHHRVHHGVNPKYIDKNHGGTLIIWDRLFGTFKAEEERPVYGTTKQLESFDPVTAHVKPIRNLWQDLKTVPGFVNKIKILFLPPGWYPKELGGFRAAPEVDKSKYKKYDVELEISHQLFLLFQYLVIMGLAAGFLFTAKDMNVFEIILCTLWLLLSIMSVGTILSGHRWGLALEVLRLILLPVLVFFLFSSSLWGNTALIYTSIYVGLSMFSLIALFQKKTKAKA